MVKFPESVRSLTESQILFCLLFERELLVNSNTIQNASDLL